MNDKPKKAPRGRQTRPKPRPADPDPYAGIEPIEVIEAADLVRASEIQHYDVQVDHVMKPARADLTQRMREYRRLDASLLFSIYRAVNLTPQRLVSSVFLGPDAKGGTGTMPPRDEVIFEGDLLVAVVRIYDNPEGDVDVWFLEPPAPGEWESYAEARANFESGRAVRRLNNA